MDVYKLVEDIVNHIDYAPKVVTYGDAKVAILHKTPQRFVAVYVKQVENVHPPIYDVFFVENVYGKPVVIYVPLLEKQMRELAQLIIRIAEGNAKPTDTLIFTEASPGGTVTIYPRSMGIGIISGGAEWQIENIEKHVLYVLASLFLPFKAELRLQEDGCHNLDIDLVTYREYYRPDILELADLIRGKNPHEKSSDEYIKNRYELLAQLFKAKAIQTITICDYYRTWCYEAPPDAVKIEAYSRWEGRIVIDYPDKQIIIRQEKGFPYGKITKIETPKEKHTETRTEAKPAIRENLTPEEFTELYIRLLQEAQGKKKLKIAKEGDIIKVRGPKKRSRQSTHNCEIDSFHPNESENIHKNSRRSEDS